MGPGHVARLRTCLWELAGPNWECPSCNDSNWPYREACHNCNATRPAGGGNAATTELCAWLAEHALEQFYHQFVRAGYASIADFFVDGKLISSEEQSELVNVLCLGPAHSRKLRLALPFWA